LGLLCWSSGVTIPALGFPIPWASMGGRWSASAERRSAAGPPTALRPHPLVGRHRDGRTLSLGCRDENRPTGWSPDVVGVPNARQVEPNRQLAQADRQPAV